MMRWKMAAAAVSTVAVMTLAAVLNPIVSHADTWTLEGDSSVKNEVWLEDGTQIGTTIQTNYHAGGITGLVVRNSYADMLAMLNISSEESYIGVRPILYVANGQNGEKMQQTMKDYAGQLGGKLLYDYEILMFKWDGSSNQQVTSTTSPVKMTLGIEKANRESGYSYALLRVKDGQGTFLYDKDSDPGTLTVETTEFTGSIALIKYPSGNTPADAAPKPADTKPGSTGSTGSTAAGNTTAGSSELDDVPKTGDTRLETTVMLWMVLAAGTVTAVSALYARRKLSVEK